MGSEAIDRQMVVVGEQRAAKAFGLLGERGAVLISRKPGP